MGRVTIFALHECRHCKRVKSALAGRRIPYSEISLSDYPERRKVMLSLTDRLTVPQVFFNDKHIGGADDTTALLKELDEGDGKYSSPLEFYEAEIASVEDAPKDSRLALPTEPPVPTKPAPPRSEDDLIELPNGEKVTVLKMTQTLMSKLPNEKLGYRGRYYKNVFSGKKGVDILMKVFGLKKREEAVSFGRKLQERQLFAHVTGEHEFKDKDLFYRLQAFQQPAVLNSFRVWTDRVDSDYMALLLRLKKLMGKIESDYTDKEGLIDYIAAAQNMNYAIFEEAVCELQGVSFDSMEDDFKLAFGINLYNLMIIHAFIKVGAPNGALDRSSFFSKIGYNIGGNIYSFSELENGVLRGNKTPPGSFSPCFREGDSRLSSVLSKVDNRIHFALNCGAKSCPPVKKFSAEAIDEELRIVAQAYCEQQESVGVDEENSTVSLTMIMKWYKSDFAESFADLPSSIVNYLRGEKQEKLQRLIDSEKKIKVTFNTYDWSNNASNIKNYDKSILSVDTLGFVL